MTANSRQLPLGIFPETWDPPQALDTLELVRLYNGIEEALQGRPGAAVGVASATKSDEVVLVAYSLSWVAAKLLGKRILFVDLTDRTAPSIVTNTPIQPFAGAPPTNASDPPETVPNRQLEERGARDVGARDVGPRDVGLFSLTVNPSKELAATVQLSRVWDKVRPAFDMIIVAAPPVLDDPTAASLSGLVNGNVLVVANGESRYAQVSRASQLLTSGKAPLLGVIMMDRKRKRRWFRRSGR